MASTIFQLKSNITTIDHYHHHPKINFPSKHINVLQPYKALSTSQRFFLKSSTNPNFTKPFTLSFKCKSNHTTTNFTNSKLGIINKTQNSNGFVLDSILSALKALKKPAMAAVIAIVGLSLMHYYDTKYALAASGGFMGGDSFSFGSSSSSSGSDWSSSSWDCSSDGEPSKTPLTPEQEKEAWKKFWECIIGLVACFLGVVGLYISMSFMISNKRYSILKLQVGLKGSVQSVQRELNQIASTADTTSSKGKRDVLIETLRALRMHPELFFSAHSSIHVKRKIKEGEKLFRKLSLEERQKFDDETLVNYNNTKKSKIFTTATGSSSEYLVVTVLMVSKGEFTLPTIKESLCLEAIFQTLESIPSNYTFAIQVLWTPQAENDALSEEQLRNDYPLLEPLQ